MKPTKFPAKEKNEARKAKGEGMRESETKKSRLLCHFNLNPQILLSAHAHCPNFASGHFAFESERREMFGSVVLFSSL